MANSFVLETQKSLKISLCIILVLGFASMTAKALEHHMDCTKIKNAPTEEDALQYAKDHIGLVTDQEKHEIDTE